MSVLVKPFKLNANDFYYANVELDSADFYYEEYTYNTGAAVHTIYATDRSSKEEIIVGWLVPKSETLRSNLDVSSGYIIYNVTTLYELWNSSIAEEKGLSLYFKRGYSPQSFPKDLSAQQIGLWNVDQNREETELSLVRNGVYTISCNFWADAFPNNLPPFLEDISAEWAKERTIYAPIKANKIKITYDQPIEYYVYKIDWSDIKRYSTNELSVLIRSRIDETSAQNFIVYASREDKENDQPINSIPIYFGEIQSIVNKKLHYVELNDGNKLYLSWATLCAIAEDSGVDLESELVLQADDSYIEINLG